MDSYKYWIQLHIEHEYYNPDNIPLNLSLSDETKLFFIKSGILFRQFAKNQWNLLLPTGELEDKQLLLWSTEIIVMKFNIIPTLNDFYYTSVLKDIDEDIYSVNSKTQFKVWKQIEIPFTESLLNTSTSITIPIKAVKKYLEFILIPKYNTADTIILAEEKGKIEFDEIKKIPFLNQEAFQFKSVEPVLIKENHSYKIKLWEIRKNGNRLLSDSIPLPQQNEPSIIDSSNTISTYFYY